MHLVFIQSSSENTCALPFEHVYFQITVTEWNETKVNLDMAVSIRHTRETSVTHKF
jgi:hypothetical protein